MPVITVNLDKAKAIAHAHRRAARAREFAPYDQVVALQVPGQSTTDAEAARAKIRTKYAGIQTSIDAATTPDQLMGIIKGFALATPAASAQATTVASASTTAAPTAISTATSAATATKA